MHRCGRTPCITGWHHKPLVGTNVSLYGRRYSVQYARLGSLSFVHASGKFAPTVRHANTDITVAATAMGSHLRKGFFTQATIVQITPTTADTAEPKRRMGQRRHHKNHMFIPASEAATNWAVVAPPAIKNTYVIVSVTTVGTV